MLASAPLFRPPSVADFLGFVPPGAGHSSFGRPPRRIARRRAHHIRCAPALVRHMNGSHLRLAASAHMRPTLYPTTQSTELEVGVHADGRPRVVAKSAAFFPAPWEAARHRRAGPASPAARRPPVSAPPPGDGARARPCTARVTTWCRRKCASGEVRLPPTLRPHLAYVEPKGARRPKALVVASSPTGSSSAAAARTRVRRGCPSRSSGALTRARASCTCGP